MSGGAFSYRSYSLTIQAGEAAHLNVFGTYLACLNANHDEFRIRLNSGPSELFAKGLKVSLAGAEPLTLLTVENPNASVLNVEFAVGSGDIHDARFAIVGSLDVRPEFPPFYTDEAKTFHGGTQQLAAAAEYSHIQLLNPAASGVTCYLARASVSVASGNIEMGVYDTALPGLSGSPINKTLGGAAAACQLRYDGNVALLGSTINVFDPAAAPYVFDWSVDPFVLPPGKGLIVRAATVNVSLFAMFDWREL